MGPLRVVAFPVPPLPVRLEQPLTTFVGLVAQDFVLPDARICAA